MQCTEFTAELEHWPEGPNSAAARQHLDVCPCCRNLIADLQAIQQAARALEQDTPEPPDHLWVSLRSRLEEEGLIRQRRWSVRLAGWTYLVPRPALVGACFVLLFTLATGMGLLRPAAVSTLPVPEVDAELSAEMLAVRAQVNQVSRVVRDPVVAASYRENLAIVENLIRQCEKAVREQPDNLLAREYLYTAWRQKAELVATITERGTVGAE
jgi:hypothetical protein